MPHRCRASRSRSEAAQSFARRASARIAMTRSIASCGSRLSSCPAAPSTRSSSSARAGARTNRPLSSAIGSFNHDSLGSMPSDRRANSVADQRRVCGKLVKHRERCGGIHVVVESRFHPHIERRSLRRRTDVALHRRKAIGRLDLAEARRRCGDRVFGKVHRLAVAGLQKQPANRLRIVASQRVGERLEVAERFRHLACRRSAARRAPRCSPSADAASAARSARSRSRDAERSGPRRRRGYRSRRRRIEQLARHRRTLDVPARPPSP